MKTLYDRVWARYGKQEPGNFMEGLRSRMLTHGVTQKALANRAGVGKTHMSRWMNRHVAPSLETKLILDEALDQLIAEGK